MVRERLGCNFFWIPIIRLYCTPTCVSWCFRMMYSYCDNYVIIYFLVPSLSPSPFLLINIQFRQPRERLCDLSPQCDQAYGG
jgi:hypothetical protein